MLQRLINLLKAANPFACLNAIFEDDFNHVSKEGIKVLSEFDKYEILETGECVLKKVLS